MTREEAIEILQEERDWAQQVSYVNKALDTAIKVLKEPPRPHAHWKDDELCSHCGHSVYYDLQGDIQGVEIDTSEYYYCPACGAIMDEKEK